MVLECGLASPYRLLLMTMDCLEFFISNDFEGKFKDASKIRYFQKQLYQSLLKFAKNEKLLVEVQLKGEEANAVILLWLLQHN